MSIRDNGDQGAHHLALPVMGRGVGASEDSDMFSSEPHGSPHINRDGFTLIEIMIALAVLGISLTVLLGLRNRDIALSAYSGHMTEATLLARQRISEVSFAGFPDLGAREGDFGEDHPNYKWKEEVKQTPYDVVRELNLEVLWTEGGREESVRFTTFLFNARG